MSEHTPTPWKINKYGSIGAGGRGADVIVAQVEPFYGPDRKNGSSEANAAFIVRACNSHDELVAALNAMLEAATSRPWTPGATLAIAREAISKATESPNV